ncbi:hypothetical protein BP5796_07045 [Coleophoma crateriformis]|uniref:DUF7888 domain-containing protein n=1 Tax=Coleophoma crateriformis TaxID=565419 RepID=A0A3D8RHT5_9HELO|nr:hypothetical protein BP5796_07045 [Coleophoma crateriformis]
MRFSAVTAVAYLSAFATAATIPTEARSLTDVNTAPVEKRQLITALVTAFLTAAATEAGTLVVEDAVNAAVAEVNKVSSDFTTAREQFTQATTLNMWNSNPAPATNVAVICQNEGFTVSNTSNVHNEVSAKLTSGLLNVDYECFYMSAPNTYTPQGDGGFQNTALRFTTACTRDSSSGVLTCN